jgi:hypothetical protein
MDIVADVISRQEVLQQFFYNGWLNLVAIDPNASDYHRFNTDATWEPVEL